MLPNHAPLMIAEQFGTLESLYPERIDLGHRPRPGTDQATAHALRRDFQPRRRDFRRDVQELRAYLRRCSRARLSVRFRGQAYECRSGCSVQASSARNWPRRSGCRSRSRRHFAPDYLMQALDIYSASSDRRSSSSGRMRWSVSASSRQTPTLKLSALATSLQQQWLNLRRGRLDLCSRPSTAWKEDGRRSSRLVWNMRWLTRRSELRTPLRPD